MGYASQVIPGFPAAAAPCPVCHTTANRETVLVPVMGPQGNLAVLAVHRACHEVVLAMEACEAQQNKKGTNEPK